MEEIVRIPDERIGVLIGPEGTVKRNIERKTKTKITVDSGEGEVTITGKGEIGNEGELFFKAKDIVRAIARGFSPERAYKLLEEDYFLKVIEIPEFVGKNPSNQKAKRGRVIGRKGSAREQIEKKTRSLISVQGKTVAIIAKPDDLEAAIESVEMLLKGAKHETVEHYLAEQSQDRFEL